MNKKTLLDWENKHNAIMHTMGGFWNCFKKWREEDKDVIITHLWGSCMYNL
ncbi:hypothetical protein [Candidatus Pristimantibacillus sp. PTI5]|uniref:hypothetical protein n=1 Tax=Candidatus Pristimantibacillus sp. PTI5 TaxID=3400422 RepID=UPI003B0286CA